MDIKEFDFGSWGWYFDNHQKIESEEKKFFEILILISLKYGINLSTYGKFHNLNKLKDIDILVENIFSSVESYEGNQLLKVINQNFYSYESSSFIFSSMYYSNQNLSSKEHILDDVHSLLFCTVNKMKFSSFFYNLRIDAFASFMNDNLYTNTARFNSYIRSLHLLMKNYGATLFDFTYGEDNLGQSVFGDGYIRHENECIYYEDVYDLLNEDQKYRLFEEVNIDLENNV